MQSTVEFHTRLQFLWKIHRDSLIKSLTRKFSIQIYFGSIRKLIKYVIISNSLGWDNPTIMEMVHAGLGHSYLVSIRMSYFQGLFWQKGTNFQGFSWKYRPTFHNYKHQKVEILEKWTLVYGYYNVCRKWDPLFRDFLWKATPYISTVHMF